MRARRTWGMLKAVGGAVTALVMALSAAVGGEATTVVVGRKSGERAEALQDLLERSRAARAEGIPQGMVHALRQALTGEALREQDRPAVAVELARALLDAGRESEAVELLDDERWRASPEVQFWLAQSLAQQGDFGRALAVYDSVAGIEGFRYRGEALLGKARMLEAGGRLEEALLALGAVPKESRVIHPARLAAAALFLGAGGEEQARLALESMIDPNRRDEEARAYLRAWMEGQSGDPERALERFRKLELRNRRLAASAVLGEVDALLQLGQGTEAERRLESYIFENPRSALTPELMAKLDEVYAEMDDPTNAELKRLENDLENPARATLATFYLARNDERQGRTDRAMRTYREFIEAHPEHELVAQAVIRLVVLHLERGELEAAVRVLDGARGAKRSRQEAAATEFLWGEVNFAARNYGLAAEHFGLAAEVGGELGDAALANAALAGAYAGQSVDDWLAALGERQPEVVEAVELAGVLHEGSEREARTGAALRRLAREAKDPAVRDRAALGLAEWQWMSGRADEARSSFQRVADSTGGELGEQGDYFAVYVADDGTPAGAAAAADAAAAFLAAHPESPNESAVRMKWGEVLARTGDHQAARAQFEQAAEATEDAGEREAALFLAARSSSQLIDPAMLEEAVLLFEEVRQMDGPLSRQALFELALVQNALGRPDEAIVLLDRLVETTVDARLRLAGKLKKGDTLFAMGTTDPERYAEASAVWREVAADETATVAERNEALARAASADEKRGDFDAALAGYYEVLNAPRTEEPEFFWYYKAGFDAARLLEERDQFREAAAVYEKMGATEGPRSEEARGRVKRLRLENFIWEN